MKNIVLIFLLASTTIMFAQTNNNKGEMVDYKNEFYQKIKDGIEEFEKDDNDEKRFKMDVSGINLPKSHTEFTTAWCNEPVSQGNTGTCWCFSTTSYYESEIFRLTKQKIKLSHMYIVYYEYVEKAKEYVKTRGKSHFGQGSETNASARMMSMYGIVPLKAYNAMKDGQEYYNHSTMFDEMEAYLKNLETTHAWNEKAAVTTIKSILNHYMGAPPTVVKHDGKDMTPKDYLAKVTKLKPDSYVDFMSLLEKPYFEKSEYKVPDNWWKSQEYYNLPLDDFIAVIKKTVKSGYTMAIGGDVSESGYLPKHDIAMVPSYDIPSNYIDDNARQLRFSNKATTDDHAIHLVGYLEKGDDFWFLIKDSGSGSRNGNNEGYYFYHEDYVKLKMMTFTVHEDMVTDILKKFAAK